MPEHTVSDKRLKILSATEMLIAEHGFQGLSMQKIAKEADVAAGTIYRYFKDKDDLISELRLFVTQRMADAIQANVSPDMPLKVRYRTMWLNIWQLAKSDSSALKNRIQYELLAVKDNKAAQEVEREMFYLVDEFFKEGKEQGLFKPLDNFILSGLSLEVSISLARKRTLYCYQLDEKAVDTAIEASWDAIIQH
ncbi:TetR family transcriptional regulator [Vibrio sp. 10N.286.49.B3]|uniref:TetR/AcrR family transcriptional regulator n=1 Tax=Vibrio sp. 10N.286.49.B3 TaxID=1880855 RepID=UPI000C82C4B0|nr:TetR/AcrR family transcriptional regulator [Vibrio sp. 10N.286.49.B3]PMH46086.1 TetR family transcriptional regulator [Vibrio sp. 10N.286.49.B3]